jgi:ABC-type glycerol-3-phosphate transport system permease component
MSDTRPVSVACTYAMLALLGLMFSFPFLWTLSSSLKTAQETQLFPPSLVPAVPQWVNYATVWTTQPVWRWILNSLIVIGLSVPGAVLSGTIVAYSFARFDYPGRGFLFLLLLSTLMLPFEVTLIPQYLLFYQLKWIDTFLPLTVPAWVGAGGGSAFTIFLLRQFFMTIPRDLDDAARIDGANGLRIFWDVLLPLAKPALATVAVISFIAHWDEFLRPLIYLNSTEKFPLSVGLRYFNNRGNETDPLDHLLMAAALMMSLPSVVLFFAAQKYFVRGIVMTGIKG